LIWIFNNLEYNLKTSEFIIEGEYVELNQLLKLAGLCDSGGAGKAMVSEGIVSVNGKKELRRSCKIRSGDEVIAAGLKILIK
jgi:ribosome-associated protein